MLNDWILTMIIDGPEFEFIIYAASYTILITGPDNIFIRFVIETLMNV